MHDLLTVAREDGVDCAGLIGRLEAMLGQGLGGRRWTRRLEPVHALAAQRRPRWRWCSASSSQTRSSTAAARSRWGCAATATRIELTRLGRGQRAGGPETEAGLGLTIARALVRDELAGALELPQAGKAVARFPAES